MDADEWMVSNIGTNYSMAFPQVHGWFRASHILSYDGESSDAWGEVRGPPCGVVQEEQEENDKNEGGDQLHSVA